MSRRERIAQTISEADAPSYVLQQMAFALGGTAMTTLTSWISSESFTDGGTSGIAGGILSGALALRFAYITADSVAEAATTVQIHSSQKS